MFAFNKLTGFTASLADLQLWSGDIGSDITFFFSTGTAYCTGRGEIIEPLSQLPKSDENALRVYIFKPSQGLSTKLVFQTLNIKSMCSQTDPLKLLGLFKQLGPLNAAIEGGLVNDLEPPAFECSPTLGQLKKEIMELTSTGRVMMSGSGTSIFALTDSKMNSIPTEKFDGFRSKHKDLKYFECTCISKENSVKTWYA
jgi:4-diphosphocytidyl-2-C-methyl-D-erythritol kinase